MSAPVERSPLPDAAAPTGLKTRWQSSVQFRVISMMVLLGILTVFALSTIIIRTIRDGLFDQRMSSILQESARATSQTQNIFNNSTAPNSGDLQQLLNDTVTTSAGDREVVILRPLDLEAPWVTNDVASDASLMPLITSQLRQATATGEGQKWQSIALPVNGTNMPGVAVGSLVTASNSGAYELYFIYSLQPEEQTMRFIQRVLLAAGIGLVVLLGSVTWYVTRQTVRPVRQVAQVAERLADGRLDERLEVRGRDEMATLGRSFNEMADSLQRQIEQLAALSEVQRSFVSDVSHELRTPLTTVRMASEMIYLARHDFDPVTRRSAELLQAQLDRFEELLADLLEISRFDAGAAVLDADRVDLGSLVDQAVAGMATLAQSKEVWLSVSIQTDRTKVDADGRRIERILRNLLANAIEHADGTPVEITVAGDHHAVAVTVRDYGVGLTKQEAQRVFDRFWRADPARARTTGGTGLGLAISQEDAALHGGWLEVWGRPGAGANFRLTLPRRAGIELVASPLPLIPPDAVSAAAPADAEHEPDSPAALPNLAEFGDVEDLHSEESK